MWREMERTSWKHFSAVSGWVTFSWSSAISVLFSVSDCSTVCLLLCIPLLPWAHTETEQMKEEANVRCCKEILNKIVHDFSFDRTPSSHDTERARKAFILTVQFPKDKSEHETDAGQKSKKKILLRHRLYSQKGSPSPWWRKYTLTCLIILRNIFSRFW